MWPIFSKFLTISQWSFTLQDQLDISSPLCLFYLNSSVPLRKRLATAPPQAMGQQLGEHNKANNWTSHPGRKLFGRTAHRTQSSLSPHLLCHNLLEHAWNSHLSLKCVFTVLWLDGTHTELTLISVFNVSCSAWQDKGMELTFQLVMTCLLCVVMFWDRRMQLTVKLIP